MWINLHFPLLIFFISCVLLVSLFFFLSVGLCCLYLFHLPWSHCFILSHFNLLSLSLSLLYLSFSHTCFLSFLPISSLPLHPPCLSLSLWPLLSFPCILKESFSANICLTVSVEPSESIWAQPGSTGQRETERERKRRVRDQCIKTSSAETIET